MTWKDVQRIHELISKFPEEEEKQKILHPEAFEKDFISVEIKRNSRSSPFYINYNGFKIGSIWFKLIPLQSTPEEEKRMISTFEIALDPGFYYELENGWIVFFRYGKSLIDRKNDPLKKESK